MIVHWIRRPPDNPVTAQTVEEKATMSKKDDIVLRRKEDPIEEKEHT